MLRKLNIKTTIVFKIITDALLQQKKVVALQGGTRAAKTYNTLIWLIVYAFNQKEQKFVSIVRKTLPALKATAERDFFELLKNYEIYKEENHNKTDRTYQLEQVTFEFFSCDNEQKLRGRKRDVLFMNEAIEFSYDEYRQLALRTKDLIILDYNPSAYEHWIYDYVINRGDCSFHKLTYKDNPFLPQNIVREIELLRETDEVGWQVFGLGERGADVKFVFKNYEIVDKEEIGSEGELVYGIDFGFNSPTAVVAVRICKERYVVQELLYSRGLTNSMLIAELKKIIKNRNATIYCDSAEPARIHDLTNAGFRAVKSNKDVNFGIIAIKNKRLCITEDSKNLISELKNYKYKQNASGETIDEVIKLNDHAIDAMRYAIATAMNFLPVRNKTIQKKIKSPI